MIKHEIILKNLPKISLNAWYSGKHWSERDKIKNVYKMLLCKEKRFYKDKAYKVDAVFEFEKSPLDASNCAAMYKLIEDQLFENDDYLRVLSVTLASRKAKFNKVILTIIEL